MTLVNLPGCTALHRRFSALVLSNKAGMKQGTNLQAPSTDERDQRITAGRRSDLDDCKSTETEISALQGYKKPYTDILLLTS
jgi:hypothetical protein